MQYLLWCNKWPVICYCFFPKKEFIIPLSKASTMSWVFWYQVQDCFLEAFWFFWAFFFKKSFLIFFPLQFCFLMLELNWVWIDFYIFFLLYNKITKLTQWSSGCEFGGLIRGNLVYFFLLTNVVWQGYVE
jgi:hypothetical protein